jgi:hypothetical protein
MIMASSTGVAGVADVCGGDGSGSGPFPLHPWRNTLNRRSKKRIKVKYGLFIFNLLLGFS